MRLWIEARALLRDARYVLKTVRSCRVDAETAEDNRTAARDAYYDWIAIQEGDRTFYHASVGDGMYDPDHFYVDDGQMLADTVNGEAHA